jgi:DNA helicase-2/ATP-dependent DNA helicase PcrA
VLAVAGSGKSTTMAHRIQHLICNQGVRPGSIQVLMFNALARKQFTAHLDKIGLAQTQQPVVHTFHSFSFHVINEMVKRGYLPPNTQFWLGNKAELVWLHVKKAITNLEKARKLPPDAVDPQDALNTIGLWKSCLIPPERAGSHNSPHLPLVYAAFEKLRLGAFALTFDDFIPLAIQILESDPHASQRWCNGLQTIIVDEYQDVNCGQQRLIELLAGSQADVMVVGDDDQTIYEWRGARPNYIIDDFAHIFDAKPVLDYRLSRSFRFGPLIAQSAANVIRCNTNRVEKPLIAFQSKKPGFVHLLGGGYDSIKELAEQVQALVEVEQVPPNEIIVLARLYSQLDNLEAEFLTRGIPYRVDGQEPFFKRSEIGALLNYLRLALAYNRPMTREIGDWLLSVANKPSRMLARGMLQGIISTATQKRMSLMGILLDVNQGKFIQLNRFQLDCLQDLWVFLELLGNRIQEPDTRAGDLLAWMVETLGYLDYFQDYYGEGEHSDDKRQAVTNFIRYIRMIPIKPVELLDYLSQLDTTQGKPDEELIVFTTIFRTKGLEYDYVVIPQCDENVLPYLRGQQIDIYDTAGLVQERAMSSLAESERRLFYVALTRARKGVLIGMSETPSRFLEELTLEQTGAVIEAMLWLASGQASAKTDLLQALKQVGVNPGLMANLVDGYLLDLGLPDLAAQIQDSWTVPIPTKEVHSVA